MIPSTRHLLSVAFLAVACDGAAEPQTLREKIAAGLADAAIPLADAIATAQTEASGVAVEAKLEVEDGAPTYRIEVVGDAGQSRVEIDPTSGTITRNRPSSSGNVEDNAANAAFAAGADWAALIAAAEAHVGGEAFEIEADDGVFEAKVLVDLVVYELDLSAAGEIVKSEVSDDFEDEDDDGDEDEDEDEDEDTEDTGHDDGTGGHDGDDEDTGGSDDDGGG
jgi:Peptidase propeptide and YPEB domain